MWMKKLNYLWNKDRDFYFNKGFSQSYFWYWAHFGQPAFGMHATMFKNSIETFCDEEQAKKWLPLTINFDILGCYAQTELGHGSNVSGLETTAIYDKKTDEFVLCTPTITSTKWWPGDMGRYANHALVFAQLIILDEDGERNNYGVNPFIVQIRDRDTHKHMPGIKCGDMGPKFGYTSKDNGWLTLDDVRIPRENMPCRFVKVDRDGSVSIQGDLRIIYSTMLKTRFTIINAGSIVLLSSTLTACRYSAVRRQFKNISGSKEETQLLDYQT
jgi:acyl-CoA oxidase